MARHIRSTNDPYTTATLPKIGRTTAANSTFAAVVAGLCIAYWLVAIGLVLCCINPTTWLFSTLNSDAADSPYSATQLTQLAQVTRGYTVEGMDSDDLYAAIGNQAKTLSAYTIKTATSGSVTLSRLKKMSDADAGRTLAPHAETLSLPTDAMTHLNQVHGIFIGAFLVLIATVIAGICSIVFLLKRSRRSLARALLGAGGVVLGLFAVAGIWAASDFDTLFAAFHSLFFPAGTWTFDTDSLLICMYPESFWTSMGIVWGVVTAIACLVTLSIGSRTKRNA